MSDTTTPTIQPTTVPERAAALPARIWAEIYNEFVRERASGRTLIVAWEHYVRARLGVLP